MGDIALPASAVNNLRREGLEKLEKELGRIKTVPFDKKKISIYPHMSGKTRNIYRFSSPYQIPKKLLKKRAALFLYLFKNGVRDLKRLVLSVWA